MPISDSDCSICGEELNAENYYYIYTGRLQQGVMSDTRTNKEYVMCSNCFAQINADLLASIQRRRKLDGK